MARFSDLSGTSRFPLVEDRAKGLKLLGVMILGRAVRDLIVPADSQVWRGIYVGALVSVMLFLLVRPGVARARAALWAVIGGLATAAVVAW
jgi:hypothetical protein